MIQTNLVQGFLGAGKTTYIERCIYDGSFHQTGTTLLLCFEEGEKDYDVEKLRAYRTALVGFDPVSFGEEESAQELAAKIEDFCLSAIEKYRPDRIYVEMNCMMPGLLQALPAEMEVVSSTTLLDGTTLETYYENLRQFLQNMLSSSTQAIINRCQEKEALEKYAAPFRLMNSRCDYLLENPLGYHEKAFARYLPYDLSLPSLWIEEEAYPLFHLDIQENPEHYAGKEITFLAQVRFHQQTPEDSFYLGRVLITCCLWDAQFLGFFCKRGDTPLPERGSWIRLTAVAQVMEDGDGKKIPLLNAKSWELVDPPKVQILGLS